MESETLPFSSESGIRVNDAGKTGPELRSPVPVHVSDDVEGFEGNDLLPALLHNTGKNLANLPIGDTQDFRIRSGGRPFGYPFS